MIKKSECYIILQCFYKLRFITLIIKMLKKIWYVRVNFIIKGYQYCKNKKYWNLQLKHWL
jgi:hypothetical protein